jgi:hypothetical protein
VRQQLLGKNRLCLGVDQGYGILMQILDSMMSRAAQVAAAQKLINSISNMGKTQTGHFVDLIF